VNVTQDLNITSNIYNLGGLTYYTFIGDGERVEGGRPFDLKATNGTEGSSALAEQIYRKLQHFHTSVELDLDPVYDIGLHEFNLSFGYHVLEYGFDYRLNGTWKRGVRIRIYPVDGDVGTHSAGNDQDWIEWIVSYDIWNNSASVYQEKRVTYIGSNFWGYDTAHITEHTNRTTTNFFIDIWFDKDNQSSTLGCMVYPHYYGMFEQGSLYWFGYGNFRPLQQYSPSKFFWDVLGTNDEIINSYNLNLIKVWCKVSKVSLAAADDEYIATYHEETNKLIAGDRMEGIDEPTRMETKVLNMPQQGFLAPLVKAIKGIQTGIWKGALGFVAMLWGAIDSLMELMGLGEWWRSFSNMLNNIAIASLAIMSELELSLFSSVILIDQIFRLLTITIVRYTYVVTQFISSIILWYQYIVQMFIGGGIFSINVWGSLNLGDWFVLGMHLSPIWWLNRLNESDSFFTTLQGDIRFFLMLVTGLFSFLSGVILLTIELINTLLGMLPI